MLYGFLMAQGLTNVTSRFFLPACSTRPVSELHIRVLVWLGSLQGTKTTRWITHTVVDIVLLAFRAEPML